MRRQRSYLLVDVGVRQFGDRLEAMLGEDLLREYSGCVGLEDLRESNNTTVS